MHGQHLHFIRQPFEETVDTTFFFSGGGRGEIVAEIVGSLQNGVSLVTLIGPPGSGKTMICKEVEERLPASMISVYLPAAVESFNDMVEIVGREVVRDSDVLAHGSTEEILMATAAALRQQGRQLLIIFEEAEHIYLATLERIRRMLDRVNDEGLLLRILLSGGPQLAESLEQLGIVAFREVEERNVVLDNLDQPATEAYLRHCLDVATAQESYPFPPEIVNGIYGASGGNFRQINQLARQYLQDEETDTPFLVMLDSLSKANGQAAKRGLRRSRTTPGWTTVDLDFLKFPTVKPAWLVFGGGLLLLVLLVVWWMERPPGDSRSVSKTDEIPTIELQPVEPLQEGTPESTDEADSSKLALEGPTTTQPPPTKPEPLTGGEEQYRKLAPRESSEASAGTAPVAAVSGDTPMKDRREPQPLAEQATDSSPGQAAETEAEAVAHGPAAGQKAEEEDRQISRAQEERGDDQRDVKQAEVVETSREEAATSADTVIVRPVIVADQEKKSVLQEPAKERMAAAETPPIEPPLLTADKVKRRVQPEPESDEQTVTTAPPDTQQAASAPTSGEPTPASQAEAQPESEATAGGDGRVEVTQKEPPPAVPVEQPSVEEIPETKPEESMASTPRAPQEIQPTEAPATVEPPPVEQAPETKAEESTTSPITAQQEIQPAISPATVEQPSVEEIPEPKPEESMASTIPAPQEIQPAIPPATPVPPPLTPANGDSLYQERLAAGARWLVGGGSGRFTVQVMVLTSDHAEDNLKQMLAERDYRAIADNLYVLRRLGDPPTVMLYFGEYRTLAAAQQARNTLPLFLRRHDPYPIAVNVAVEKTRGLP